MTEYRYELLNHPKLICPNCGKKEFNGLVYKGTKNYVDPSKYGRCDRVDKCGYDLRPPTAEGKDAPQPTIRKFPTAKKRYYMDEKVLEGLQKNALTDSFSLSMKAMFDKEKVKKVFDEYGVVCGSEKKPFINYTGFVYRDINGKFVSIKMFMYKNDLHRDKDVGSSWLHSWCENKPKEYEEFAQPWYGEQLIGTTKYKYIGIVESEKTALICRILDDSVLWLACGGVGNIKHSAVKGLLDKKCIFYPDHDGWNNWKKKFDEINKGNWRISQLPLEFTEKQDIADILLTDASFMAKIQEEYDELYDTVITVEEEKYYKSLTKTYSEDDWNVILQTVGLTNYIAKIVKEDFVVGGKNVQRKDVVFYEKGNAKQRFEFAELFKDKFLDNFCTQKMIPKFTDIKREHFSYNFEKHEFLDFLNTFPDTFFSNFEFHLDDYSFYHNKKRFPFDDIIVAKLERVEKSSLNEDHIKISQNRCYRESIADFKNNFYVSEKNNIKNKTFGIYEGIIERGRNFNEMNNITSIDDWFKIFSLMWRFEKIDFEAFTFFTIANIRIRLFEDSSWQRTLILWGDGGIGKDNIFPCLLTGVWRKNNPERFWENSTEGATGFSTTTPERAMTYLLQIISDNLEKANISNELDKITNSIIKVENKGKDVVEVRKRFLNVITNNTPNVIFKKITPDTISAYARRLLLCHFQRILPSLYQKHEYDRLFNFFQESEQHRDLICGWWYSCFCERDNRELILRLSQNCYNYAINHRDMINYQTNDDGLIVSSFERICELAENNSDEAVFKTQVIRKTISQTDYFVTSNIDNLVETDLLKKFSKDTIRKALECKYGQKIEFRKSIKISGSPTKAICIKCTDVLTDSNSDSDDLQSEELQDIPAIDLVKNLTTYLRFGDNQPELSISDIRIEINQLQTQLPQPQQAQSPIEICEQTLFDDNDDFTKTIDQDLPF